jgi:hypothetical protein
MRFKEREQLEWQFFAGKIILKIMMFHEVTTVLNEKESLEMVIWSAPDNVSIIVDQTE